MSVLSSFMKITPLIACSLMFNQAIANETFTSNEESRLISLDNNSNQLSSQSKTQPLSNKLVNEDPEMAPIPDFAGPNYDPNYDPSSDPENDRYFPIWGQESRALGYELPKTYGFSISYMSMDQPLHIKSIDLAGGPGNLLDGISEPLFDKFLDISDADQKADNVTLRADMWVLPFLNFYGLLGYTDGKSTAPITCKANRPSFSLRPESAIDNTLASVLNSSDLCGKDTSETRKVGTFNLDYEGFTYGVGMTMAGGVGNWFSILDINFSRTELDILTGQIDSLIISPRVGYRFMPHGKELRVWVGGMYQGIQQEMGGDLSDILDGPILSALTTDGTFEVKQELDSEWNTTIGANYVIDRHWGIITEFGFGERTSAFASLEYRY